MPSPLATLNRRVLTVILLVALPVLLIGAAIVLSIGQMRLRAAETSQLQQIAAYTAAAVDAYVYRRILDGALLGRVPDIRRAAAGGNQQPYDERRAAEIDQQWQADAAATAAKLGVLASPASEFLGDLVKNDSVYREVLVTDRHGRLVAASNVTSDYLQSDEAWWIKSFDEGRGRISVTDVQRDESAQVYSFDIAIPVSAPGSDEVVGVMKIVADSREMLVGVASLELSATAEALLLRPDGTIVFRRQPHAPEDRFFAADLLRERLDDRARRKEAPDTLAFEARSDENTRRIVAIAPSQLWQSFPELSWLLAVSIEREELRGPFRSLGWYLVLVVILTALAVLAIALWLSLRLAAPPIDPAYDMHLVEHARVRRLDDEA